MIVPTQVATNLTNMKETSKSGKLFTRQKGPQRTWSSCNDKESIQQCVGSSELFI